MNFMKNAVISELFSRMADIMEILGDDPFRINSYRKVARVVNDTPADVEVLDAEGKLAELPGIGKSSLAKIEEFIKTGKMTAYEELIKKIPSTLLDLLKIPGIGPKGVKAMYEKLEITNIAELKKAIADGTLAKIFGFGEKKVSAIAKGIEFIEKSTGRIRIDQATEAAQLVADFLKELPGIKQIETAGSVRRRADTIGDVDILVAADDGKKIIDKFTKAQFVQEVLAAGETKGSAIIQTTTCHVHVDVRVVAKESFGAALQYFTGSKQHNVRLREIAVKKKWKLNEYGLFDGDKIIAGKNETEIYKKLGLDFVEPVLREGRGEIEAAQTHKLPKVIELADIKGDMHIHTNASDGVCEPDEIIEAVKKLGYKYICITDHSKSSAIANGLSLKRLAEEIKKIQRLNEKIKGLEILIGTEVDILANGSIDFDNEVLAELDFVTASIHSALGGSREKVTNRTLKAMDNPYVNSISHPTGRLIGEREPMDLDIEAVIKHAVKTGTALELNAHPMRLDLKDMHCKMAIEQGVKLIISTDTHHIENLSLMQFGVATAARGWVTKESVLNTHPLAKIRAFIKTKRPK